MPTCKRPRIHISRQDIKILTDAGYLYETVRGWFFKTSGPSASKLEDIGEVLGRKVETIAAEEEESVPETFIPDIYQEGSGFCWVPLSAWKGFKKEEVCDLCVKKNAVCRKAVWKAGAVA